MAAAVISRPEPAFCPGSGQPPAGSRKGRIYGGGCAVCQAQVSVTTQWVIRPHEPGGKHPNDPGPASS